MATPSPAEETAAAETEGRKILVGCSADAYLGAKREGNKCVERERERMAIWEAKLRVKAKA